MSSSSPAASSGLHKGLWVAQGLLGFAFFMGGAAKLFMPQDALIGQGMIWAGRWNPAMIKFIGLAEVLGGIGLILPSALKIQPKLTPVAASCLVLVMVLAAGEHATNGELMNVPVNVVLGGLAAFVAWGRFLKVPIAPKG